MSMSFLKYLTNGRPMTRGEYRFRSDVNGQPVYYFTDAFGRRFLAQHKWALFRVPVPDDGDDLEQMLRDVENLNE